MAYGQSRFEQRLLVHLVEDLAKETPNRVFSSFPKTADLKDGFADITFLQVVQAVDFLCHFLRGHFGPKPDHDFETLTYIGVPDVRYTLLLYAGIKCRYKTGEMFFPSPRNPAPVNLSLMEQTNSTKVLHSAELAPVAKGLSSTKPGTKTLQIPSLDELLAAKAEHVPYQAAFEESLRDPILVLHSSGSTGLPKPITLTNGTAAVAGTDRSFRTPEGRKKADFTIQDFDGHGGRVYNPFPAFHMAGFYTKSVIPVYTLAIPVYGPPLRLPSAELVLEVMENLDLRGASLPPSLLEGLLHLPNGREYLKKLHHLSYAGGPLSLAAGEEVSKYTKLYTYYGSTESGSIRQLLPLPGNWAYMEFHPDEPLRMDPAEDDTYELVLVADPRASKSYAGAAAFTYALPGLTEYRSKDLFRRHPTNPNLWQFHGRRDDIFVLSTGEKFNPVPMEVAVGSDAAVAAALVVGVGYFRPALLIEPKPEYRDSPDLRQRVWLAVQRANLDAPGPGRVSEDMIVISDPERPFMRAGKGTVVRKLTTALYEQDIASLYNKEESAATSLSAAAAAAASIKLDAQSVTLANLTELVRSILAGLLPGASFDDATNVYLMGLDSLKTAEAVASLTAHIGSRSWLTPNLCYTNPTVQELASALFARISGAHVAANEADDQVAKMKSIIAKYVRSSQTETAQSTKPIVAITGTTGNLGTELFNTLLESGEASQIICLNRSPSAQARWEKHAAARPSTKHPTTITFYTVDLTQPKLGLSENEAAAVQASDVLIHGAWKVDFNQSLASFEDDLAGLRNVIDLCALSRGQTLRRPHLVFISSISSAGSLEVVPDAAVGNLGACLAMGYGQSKLVAEHIVEQAGARDAGLTVTVLRVGQIAGSLAPGGTAWPEKEVVPGMFRTSRALGLVPGNLPPVNWIAIDQLARVILELSLLRRSGAAGGVVGGGASYYNLVNPHETPWREVVGVIAGYCGPTARVVELSEWVAALRALDRTDRRELDDKPALKTLEFFDNWAARIGGVGPATARYETARAAADSHSFARLRPVDERTMAMWLERM